MVLGFLSVKVATEHRRGPTEDGSQVEVESDAYIVCDALGLDTNDYRFAYVASWAEASANTARDVGERAVDCARNILDGLEEATVSPAT